MNFRSRCTLACANMFLLGGSLLVAETGPVPPSDSALAPPSPVFSLGAVVVTGKAKKDMNNTVSADDIAKYDKSDVAKALNLLPGVTLSQMGARNEGGVYVRGFDSRQVALFMDGIPVYVPYDGNIDLTRFSSSGVSQISVEKGASSLLYGPNGMGGVINITSLKPVSPLDLSATLGYVSEGRRASLNAGTKQGDFYGMGSVAYLYRDNYKLSSHFVPTKYENGGDYDNSYSEDRTINLLAGYTPQGVGDFNVIFSDQHGRKGTPVYAGANPAGSYRYWKWPYYDKRSLYTISRIELGKAGYLKIPLYYDQLQNSLYSYNDTSYTTMKRPYCFQSAYADHSFGGSMEYGTGLIPRDTLKAAIHYKNDYHREWNTTNDTARATDVQKFVVKPDIHFRDYTLSYALENLYMVTPKISLVPGIAYNLRKPLTAENLTGNPGTYAVTDFPMFTEHAWDIQMAAFYRPSRAHTFNASLAQRTRFPSIKDRYSYRLGSAIPNPDLKPERATHVEVGYAGTPLARLKIQASLSGSYLEDIIQSVTVGPGTTYQLQNTGKARFSGPDFGDSTKKFALPAPELGITYTVLEDMPFAQFLSVSANYSYLKRRNLTNPSLFFTDVPDNKILLGLEYNPITRVGLVWSTELNSERLSSSDGKWRAKGFSVSNVKAKCSYSRFAVELGVNNLFDKDYCLQEGYPAEGRNIFANVSANFRK
ncbi:MAG: TonB-dependent receptor plug domain-containing protein [Fibrobacterota bacterium]